MDRLSLAGFIFAVGFFGFTYGLVAGIFSLPPAPSVAKAYQEFLNAARHWKNDIGLQPSRHLVEGYPDRRQRFSIFRPERMGNGNLLVSGLTPRRKALNTVILYDARGRELHAWPVDYRRIVPRGRPPQNVFLHGLAAFRDGSIMVNFDSGNALARIGPCGEVLWTQPGEYHHVVSRSYDGTVWTWRGEAIVQIDPRDGRVMREIDIVRDIMTRHRLQGVLAIRAEEDAGDKPLLWNDPFHGNHVEVLSPKMARAFPKFRAGDLLISLRSLNLVAVVDARTHVPKWWQIGPWHRQHHPRFQRDGSILVYNNNMGFGTSQILKVYPSSGRTRVVFEGSEKAPFYSWRRGKHQMLADGNLLITESERGRAFIVTPEGDIVWEYNNVYDATRNGVLNKVTYLPPDFFHDDALRCR